MAEFILDEAVWAGAVVLFALGMLRSAFEMLHVYDVQVHGSFVLFQSLHLTTFVAIWICGVGENLPRHAFFSLHRFSGNVWYILLYHLCILILLLSGVEIALQISVGKLHIIFAAG